MNKVTEQVRINAGLIKLYTFFVMFIMASHILACLWIFIAMLNEENNKTNTFESTWLKSYKEPGAEESNADIYLISLYWVITTLSTVGYGDLSANNVSERIFCILLMIGGTVWFSYINGTIFGLLQTCDESEAALEAKYTFLDTLNNEY